MGSDGADDAPPPKFAAVVGWLLDIAAAPSLPASGFARAEAPEGVGLPQRTGGDILPVVTGLHGSALAAAAPSLPLFGSGNVAQALASEAVALARTLVSFQSWRDVLTGPLQDAVVEAAALLAPPLLLAADEPPSPPLVETQAAARVLGSLAILGGFVEPLRIGGRVSVAPERIVGPPLAGDAATPEPATSGASGSLWGLGIDLSGTLVRLRLGDALADVVYTRDLAATPSTVDAARLRPLPEVLPPASLLRLATPRVLAAAKALVRLGVSPHVGAEPTTIFKADPAALASAFTTHVHAMATAALQVRVHPREGCGLSYPRHPSLSPHPCLSPPAVRAAQRPEPLGGAPRRPPRRPLRSRAAAARAADLRLRPCAPGAPALPRGEAL